MPPQQTDSGLEIEGDAAMRGLGLATGVVKASTDDTRDVSSLFERVWRAFGKWRQRRRSRTSLHELSDRALKDIGVTRDEIDHVAPLRAIDALKNSIYARGVM
jgi:uncharacterized protein YjiS (DUF1127 family)